MRFCHITTFYPPHHYGGDAIITQVLCEHLAGLGHEVDVVYCRDAFELDGYETGEKRREVPGLNVHELSSRLGWLSPIITQQTGRPGLKRRALQQILAREYDVVHFHNISLVGGPAVLAMSRAPVTLYTTHEHWLFCPTHVLWKYKSRPCDKPTCFSCTLHAGRPPQLWRYSKLVSRALDHIDRLLVPSEFTARKHREAGISSRIQLFPHFSPIQPDEAESRRVPDTPVFLYTGRVEKSKGIEQLLATISARPEYRLIVAGGGRLECSLRNRYAPNTNISFLGVVPHREIQSYLKSATAAIVPSWGPEVSPLSVIEAMSCGVPVIVRRAGGSAEPVENGGGGWIYEQPEQLLPLLDRIALDRKLVIQQGQLAFNNAQQNFRIDSWMDRYFSLIESINNETPAEEKFPIRQTQLRSESDTKMP
jgi:glycosyltransferase involved in cell wall biosynthesis